MVLKGGSTTDGATLTMRSASGIEYIKFDADASGDARVFLSNDAISAGEILDEPGLASNQSTRDIDIVVSQMVDLDTVTITIPKAGYIFVQGSAAVYLYGTTGMSYAGIQIDESAGGTADANHISWFGFNDAPSDTFKLLTPATATRVYFKSAGTYQFRLEGMQYGYNHAGATSNTTHESIVAMYIPTSYGDVLETVSSDATGEYDNATPETVTRTNPDGSTTTETVYRVNLRDLELKATRARLAAEQAERELLEAQMQKLQAEQEKNE
jgi:hypothetical protein